MDYKMIEQLLNKYWNGESSIQDEKILKTYFSKQNIHPDFLKYKPLFQYYTLAKDIEINDKIEREIIHDLKPIKGSKIKKLKYWTRASAAAILLFFSVWSYQNYSMDTTKHIEIENPEEAYAATKEALLLLSSKLNQGTDKATKGIVKVQDVQQIIEN